MDGKGHTVRSWLQPSLTASCVNAELYKHVGLPRLETEGLDTVNSSGGRCAVDGNVVVICDEMG